MKKHIAAAALALTAQTAAAQEAVLHTTALPYDDVIFGLESAITNRGLVVDHVSHVGDMLERTRADVGSDVVLFQSAQVFSFCSAQLSREVMEADPMNISFCPYNIFVAQLPGAQEVSIGFRSFPEGEMQVIQDLLDGIVQEAIEE
ncbi:DUF302 domain-containing protein [Leisingera caerulea]|uniref:DUF302 domain-containing protein n=1 Tax=Leisingera caerulea TaxID=506591 RepID=UPI0003F7A2D2|nr:DUF302 domain-containing protein [Leisingera caerulea]UWQ83688.1 DUF302 domain-containing protein [Leisingera caerulea]